MLTRSGIHYVGGMALKGNSELTDATGCYSLRWHDQTLQLSPERAIYWQEQHMLFLGDAHFGKALSFRRAGLAVPSGQSQLDTERLGKLITQFSAKKLLILGDLMHAEPQGTEPWQLQLTALRARFSQVDFAVIAGNHDRRRIDVLPDWQWFDEPVEIGPFRFCHEPEEKSGFYSFAGHIHPCIRLPSRTKSMRFPAFCFGNRMALLPSFGSFTGGFNVKQRDYERVFVQAEQVIELK